MPSNFTENYQLSQWEATDKVQRTDFNADNAKIDGALAGKAEQTSLDALSQTVSSLSQSRNCQVHYSTYVGAGTSGPDAPSLLNFPHKPLFVYIIGNWGSCLAMVQGHTYANRPGGRRNIVSWSGNSVSWYEESGGLAALPSEQCNERGQTYCVFAVLQL